MMSLARRTAQLDALSGTLLSKCNVVNEKAAERDRLAYELSVPLLTSA
jgi:hypothetical protein